MYHNIMIKYNCHYVMWFVCVNVRRDIYFVLWFCAGSIHGN